MIKRAFCILLVAVWAFAAVAAEPEKSVVQITTFRQTPNWAQPWRSDSVRQGSGSGFVVEGKKIMTNAHVVGWAREILVKRYQDPRPWRATVKFVAHECDLALLEVEDDSFFDSMEPLKIGDLPYVRSTVVTYGYPAGGEQISYTRGVVSRIEMHNYVHPGNRAFLTAQTDAAINPGNSGGPVIQDGQVVGVAFQGIPGLENAGFFIPPPVINHFLEDIQDGNYDGFPRAGISISSLQNPAYRHMLKLPNNAKGARVDNILPVKTTEKLIEEDDVLIEVNGYKVGSDGSIIYRGNRLSVSVAFQEAQNGESIPVTLWRKGKEFKIDLPMSIYNEDSHEGNQYDVQPRYYVHGGMVFTPLSLDYMKGAGGLSGARDLVYELTYRRREAPETVREEPIVLSSVVPHQVNADMGHRARALVDKINGVKIEKLEDVIRAIEKHEGEKHVIEFMNDGAFECLDRVAAQQANREILEAYGIRKDRHL